MRAARLVLASLLLSTLATSCHACGEDEDPAPPPATAAPTELPTASARARRHGSPPASATAPSTLVPPPPPAPLPAALDPKKPLRIGATLPAYFSWVKNIVGAASGVEVRPIGPDDAGKLAELDVIVASGAGHDAFITAMLEAPAGKALVRIRPSDAAPLLRGADGLPDPHPYLSLTHAVQEIYGVLRVLSALRPDLAPTFSQGATRYGAKLRKLRADAVQKLADAGPRRVVTVHEGWRYLCQDLGIEVVGVVERSHGAAPSTADVAAAADLVFREKVGAVLTEGAAPDEVASRLRAAGAQLRPLSPLIGGVFAADRFEKEMERNVDVVVSAASTPWHAPPAPPP